MSICESRLTKISTTRLTRAVLQAPSLRRPLASLNIEDLRVVVSVLCVEWFRRWSHSEFKLLVEAVRRQPVANSSIRSVRWWSEQKWRKMGWGRYCPSRGAVEFTVRWLDSEALVIERDGVMLTRVDDFIPLLPVGTG